MFEYERAAVRLPSDRRLRRGLHRVVIRTLIEMNGGRIPMQISDFHRIMNRLNVVVCPAPPGVPEPETTYNTSLLRGRMILPVAPDDEVLRRWLVHELAECVMYWDGRPPFYYPPQLGSCHDIAGRIEKVYCRFLARRRLSNA